MIEHDGTTGTTIRIERATRSTNGDVEKEQDGLDDNALWRPGSTLAEALRRAAIFLPVPVQLNGTPTTQAAFLADCVTSALHDGVRIGVVDNLTHHGVPYPSRGSYNFHGVTAEGPYVSIRGFTPAGQRRAWSARFDVLDSGCVDLVLPTRDRVRATTRTDDLTKAARKLLWTTALEAEPDLEVTPAARQEAIALGGPVPKVPRPWLRPWVPITPRGEHIGGHYMERRAEPCLEPMTDPLVLDTTVSPPDQVSLDRALSLANRRIYRAESRLDGYAWYDRLPRIEAVDIDIVTEKGRHRLKHLRANQNDPAMNSVRRPQR